MSHRVFVIGVKSSGQVLGLGGTALTKEPCGTVPSCRFLLTLQQLTHPAVVQLVNAGLSCTRIRCDVMFRRDVIKASHLRRAAVRGRDDTKVTRRHRLMRYGRHQRCG